MDLFDFFFKKNAKRSDKQSKDKLKMMKGRGIKLLYYVRPRVPKKDEPAWKYTLIKQAGLDRYFELNKCDVTFYALPEEKDIMEIKILCAEANFMIMPNLVKEMYFDGFKPITDWIEDALKNNKSGISYEIVGYSFEIVHRLGADESDLVPLEYFKIPEDELKRTKEQQKTFSDLIGTDKSKNKENNSGLEGYAEAIYGDDEKAKKRFVDLFSKLQSFSKESFESEEWKKITEEEFVKSTIKMHEETYKHRKSWFWYQINSKDDYMYRSLALIESMNGHHEMTIKYSTESLKINPKSAYSFYMRGRSYGDIRQFEKGIKDLSKAIEIQPKMADAYSERGLIYLKMNKIKEARVDYLKALEIEPNLQLHSPAYSIL